jgi:peptidoglycan/LPS O-acetylase OafA/YrhL
MRRIKLVIAALVVTVAAFAAFSGPAMAADRDDHNWNNDRDDNNWNWNNNWNWWDSDDYYNNYSYNPYYNWWWGW